MKERVKLRFLTREDFVIGICRCTAYALDARD